MYERRHQPLLSTRQFAHRLLWHGLVATAVIAVALALGTAGYHLTERLPWIDALLEAAMILSGMGPLEPLHTAAGKVFAGCYALYSGLALIVIVGITFGPVVHRFLHKFHLEAHRRD